jgi:hypothetical protein
MGHVPYLRGFGKPRAVQKRIGSPRNVHRNEDSLRSHKIVWRCLGAHSSEGEYFLAHAFCSKTCDWLNEPPFKHLFTQWKK